MKGRPAPLSNEQVLKTCLVLPLEFAALVQSKEFSERLLAARKTLRAQGDELEALAWPDGTPALWLHARDSGPMDPGELIRLYRDARRANDLAFAEAPWT